MAIELYKLFLNMRRNHALLKVVDDVFKFAATASKQGKPMVSRIALLNIGDGTQLKDFISLWAGIGEASPIERVRHLKAQNVALIEVFETFVQQEALSEDDKKQAKLLIQWFK